MSRPDGRRAYDQAMTSAQLQQPTMPITPAGLEDGPGSTEAALVRSVAAATTAKTITGKDAAAVAAALAIARSLDEAIGYGATLETVIKGTTALRAYLAALNLTPASRDNDSYVDPDPDPGDATPDWLAGAASVRDPADPKPA